MPKLLADLSELANVLEGCEAAKMAVCAELKSYAYALTFSKHDSRFSEFIGLKEHFGKLFEIISVPQNAAENPQDAAALMLACELEAVAHFKQACGVIDDEVIKDLFFRIWAMSVTEIQPALRKILAPEPSGGVDELVNQFIKDILNKE